HVRAMLPLDLRRRAAYLAPARAASAPGGARGHHLGGAGGDPEPGTVVRAPRALRAHEHAALGPGPPADPPAREPPAAHARTRRDQRAPARACALERPRRARRGGGAVTPAAALSSPVLAGPLRRCSDRAARR